MDEGLLGDEPLIGDFCLRQFQVGYPWQIGLRTRYVYGEDIIAMTRGDEFQRVRDLLDPWLHGIRAERSFDLPPLAVAGARLTARGFGEAGLSFSITEGTASALIGWFGGGSSGGANGRQAESQKALRHAAKLCKAAFGKDAEAAMIEVGAIDQMALTICSPEETIPWRHQVEALLLAQLQAVRLEELIWAKATKSSKKKSKR